MVVALGLLLYLVVIVQRDALLEQPLRLVITPAMCDRAAAACLERTVPRAHHYCSVSQRVPADRTGAVFYLGHVIFSYGVEVTFSIASSIHATAHPAAMSFW